MDDRVGACTGFRQCCGISLMLSFRFGKKNNAVLCVKYNGKFRWIMLGTITLVTHIVPSKQNEFTGRYIVGVEWMLAQALGLSTLQYFAWMSRSQKEISKWRGQKKKYIFHSLLLFLHQHILASLMGNGPTKKPDGHG